jgi:hypothetical protein
MPQNLLALGLLPTKPTRELGGLIGLVDHEGPIGQISLRPVGLVRAGLACLANGQRPSCLVVWWPVQPA